MTEPTYLHATRVAYDTVAVDYAQLVPPAFEGDLYGRAMISTCAELTRAVDAGPVADLGCGPGHVTAHLHSLGLTAFGIALSPETVAVARRTHPDLQFDEGSMTDPDLPDGTLGGILAWYSTVHTPPELLPVVFAEREAPTGPAGLPPGPKAGAADNAAWDEPADLLPGDSIERDRITGCPGVTTPATPSSDAQRTARTPLRRRSGKSVGPTSHSSLP
ncbi:class I SAM-dependent methyltransferase [Kitasatospora sp. NPDC001309]|uniref:class I SAM-dependent methyltransferase n=1 Tax=Kitasatospora sp. NPDC001309 TaxID=3364013 RepID=UPI0036AF5372